MKHTWEIPFPCLHLLAWGILKPFFAFEIRGLHHLRQMRGRLILAGNHTGLLDSLMVLAATRRYFRFVMTEEVFTWGLIGKLVRFANIIPLGRGRERRALVEVVNRLKENGAICIFPEGRLTQDGALLPFSEGAAFLQEKSGAPIVPFAIHGGFEAWPQWRPLPCFRKVVIEFGDPLMPDPALDRQTVTAMLRNRVARMKRRLDQAAAVEIGDVAVLHTESPLQGKMESL